MAAELLFEWDDDYTVGIEEIDDQHKALIAMLNSLHRAIVDKRGSVTARKILDQLADYTRTHFILEESLMRVMHYPGFDLHKEQHIELIKQVSDLQEKLDNGGVSITFELLHFLKVWLSQHINESDKRYGAFFATTNQQGYSNWVAEVDSTLKKKKWWKFW